MVREVGTVRLSADGSAEGIRLAVRPPTSLEATAGCVSLSVGVRGWRSRPIQLVDGWREVIVIPPAGLLNRGPVIVEVRVGPDVHRAGVVPGRLALSSLRLTRWEP